METVDDVRDALAEHDYLADEGLATSIFLALRLERPLLLEGEAGVGKTEVAKVLARWTGGELVRLQCYEGIDVAQAVYEWDYSRQLLHLRAVEARARRSTRTSCTPSGSSCGGRCCARSLRARRRDPAGAAGRRGRPRRRRVRGVPARDPLRLLDLGARARPFRAEVPPIVVLTSNRTRDVHDALKRRCLYHWIAHPDFERELAILRVRAPDVPERSPATSRPRSRRCATSSSTSRRASPRRSTGRRRSPRSARPPSTSAPSTSRSARS